VMSPSSSRRDRLDKRTLYQEHGVETYWAVDLEARMVERWHPADARPELIGDALLWRAYRGAPEMSIDLAWLFADLPK
jgi:Uma2 family endonuclease